MKDKIQMQNSVRLGIRMGTPTKENGLDSTNKEEVSNYIWTELNTQDYGIKIKDMAMVDTSMLKVTFWKANGSTTKWKARDSRYWPT